VGDSGTLADALRRGDRASLAALGAALIVPQRDNFVERPWGGAALQRHKRQAAAAAGDARRFGEAFEIAAFDADREAAQYPSRLRLSDGSEISLAELLAEHGEEILGRRFIERYGRCFPLLPKTLNIRELLSVQGHPPGHTELYIIIDAEPGATLRLGFREDVDAAEMAAALKHGLARQRELLASLGARLDTALLHERLGPWFAAREAEPAALETALAEWLPGPDDWPGVAAILAELKTLYWRVLDSLNTIPAIPGQVIHNATPARIAGPARRVVGAEVHALGNPEGREILALEIRRPGPTFRAWDNVRFPVRDVDVDAALAALSLSSTTSEDFLVEPEALADRPGVYVSVDSEQFRVEHLRPGADLEIDVPAEQPHSLHVLSGEIALRAADGRTIGRLGRGDSALVPIGVGAYTVTAASPADVVKVNLPDAG